MVMRASAIRTESTPPRRSGVGVPRPRATIPTDTAAPDVGLGAARRRTAWVPAATGVLADGLAAVASALSGAVAVAWLAPAATPQVVPLSHVLTAAAAIVIALRLNVFTGPRGEALRPSARWRISAAVSRLPAAALIALAANAVAYGDRTLTLTAALAMVSPAGLLVPAARWLACRVSTRPVTRIVVVGSGDVADRVAGRLSRCKDTLVVGQVDDDPVVSSTHVLSGLHDLAATCREHSVDRIVVAFSRTPPRETVAGLRDLAAHIPISVVPRLFELHSWRSGVEELHGIPLLHIPPAQQHWAALVGKRVLDATAAGIALVMLAPLIVGVAAAIKVESPGPVLFRQARTGRGGKTFLMLKFRTMVADAERRKSQVLQENEVDGPLFKMTDDPRVTRVGRWLRRTSLDELPQLVNVLTGSMSLVGPRPLPVEEAGHLDGAALVRDRVAPGITGLWQVSGRSDLSYADLQHLDAVYVQSWSLAWDIKILFRTPGSVLARRGAY